MHDASMFTVLFLYFFMSLFGSRHVKMNKALYCKCSRDTAIYLGETYSKISVNPAKICMNQCCSTPGVLNLGYICLF